MINFIILGAGRGTRMKSKISKVLHTIASFSLIEIVVSLSKGFQNSKTVVVTSNENNEEIKKLGIDTVLQKEQLGTGNAVHCALNFVSSVSGRTFILYGDTPLITFETLKKMEQVEADIVVLGFEGNVDERYGRLFIDEKDNIKKIVEFKDLKEDEKSITLFNSGVFLVKNEVLISLVPQIKNNNKSNEYYLTDIINLAYKNHHKSKFILCKKTEVIGVNTKNDLSECEKILQNRLRNFHMNNGVTLQDPHSTFFSFDTKIESDVMIEPNVFFGKNVYIASGSHIKAFSYLEGCDLGENVSVGPFARIREKSEIGNSSKIGNFVEIKNSKLGSNVKAGHLSYVGDGEIQNNCNIGAGTVFCNYNGKTKNIINVEEGVFIGSNTSLVAPLTIKKDSVIAAGSVITKNVESANLAIGRSKQVNLPNYKK